MGGNVCMDWIGSGHLLPGFNLLGLDWIGAWDVGSSMYLNEVSDGLIDGQ